MAILQGVVAAPTYSADGTALNLKQGRTGDLIVSEMHGRYREAAFRQKVMSGGITAQVTTVAAALTYTGLCLSNPVGSTVNLSILSAGWAQLAAAAAAASVGLMIGYNSGTNVTHTAAVTPKNNFVGVGSAGQGLLDSSATLPTAPVLAKVLGSLLTGAITTVPGMPTGEIDIGGRIELPPGAYCAFYTSAASGAAGMAFSFEWEEVPNQ